MPGGLPGGGCSSFDLTDTLFIQAPTVLPHGNRPLLSNNKEFTQEFISKIIYRESDPREAFIRAPLGPGAKMYVLLSSSSVIIIF